MADLENKAYLVPNAIAPGQTVTIDAGKCIRCNKCTEKCRMQTILPNPVKGEPPVIIYPDECWFCGLCVEACPKEAITLHYPINQRLFFKRKTTGEIFRIDGDTVPEQSYFKPPVG